MTTTPAPTDHDAIRKHVQLAEDWAEYGHVGDPNWHVARTLIKQVPALLDELAKTRAELDEAKRVIEAARLCVADIKAAWSDERIGPWLTTGQRALFAALDVHDANPATTAEPADEDELVPHVEPVSAATIAGMAAMSQVRNREVFAPWDDDEPADEPKATCSCIVQPFLAPPRVVHLSTCEAKPAREQCEQVDCHNFGGLPEVCGTGPLFDAPDAAS